MVMSRNTRQALMQSAINLFSTKWYGMVSIAEICRSAGLSNGSFYRHFESKEEIFCAILDYVVHKIEEALTPLSFLPEEKRFSELVKIIYDFSQDYTPLVRVFREGQ
jgi:AcrR family transcriptional regulator